MMHALELSRAELSCAIETLAAAGDAGHDAHGRPLNGTLRAGIAKLRRLWQLRFNNRVPVEEAATVREVRAAFAEEGCVFPAGINAAVVTLVRDVHYDCDVTLEVAVYGDGGMGGIPLWHHQHQGRAHLLAADSVEETGWVGAPFLLSLFSPELRAILAEKGLPISVNPEWSGAMDLDPMDEAQDAVIAPEWS